MMATAIKKEKKLSIRQTFLQPIAHVQGQSDMNQCENREGIAKGAMHDVPQIENLLGARKEQNAFGQRGLLSRHGNGVLEAAVISAPQAKNRNQPGSKTGGLQAE